MNAIQCVETGCRVVQDEDEGRLQKPTVVRFPRPRVSISAHALLRMSERSISRTNVETVLFYGIEMPVVGGFAYSMGVWALAQARAEGLDVKGLRGVVVILGVNGFECVVVTAYRNWALCRLLKRSRVVSGKRGRNGGRERLRCRRWEAALEPTASGGGRGVSGASLEVGPPLENACTR